MEICEQVAVPASATVLTQKQQHKHYLKSLYQASEILQEETLVESLLVLSVKGGNLSVYILQGMAVRLKEASAPAFQSGDMAYEFYHLYDKAVLVAAAEHIERSETEEEYDSEYDAHALVHQYAVIAKQPQRDIEEDARKPKPEMREYVHHGIEYDAARGAVLVHVAAELHDAPRLSAQSAYGSNIVQGIARDSEAKHSSQRHVFIVRLSAKYDAIPRKGIDKVHQHPYSEYREHPVTCTADMMP